MDISWMLRNFITMLIRKCNKCKYAVPEPSNFSAVKILSGDLAIS